MFLDQPDDLGEVDVIGFDSLKRGNVVGTTAATRLHGVLQLPELPLVVQAEVPADFSLVDLQEGL